MCDNFKCLSSQVGMDAGIFHPWFFAFLTISIFIFIILNYYFYTSFVLFLNPLMNLKVLIKVIQFACMQVCVSSIQEPDHVHVTIGEDKCLVDTWAHGSCERRCNFSWTWEICFLVQGGVSVIWICLSTILGIDMIHLYHLTCFTTLIQLSDRFSCYLLKVMGMLNE